MAVWLLSFADAAFKGSQKRLCASAASHGVDHVVSMGMSDLKRDPYYPAHRDLFARPRGIGNWLWKPLFIKRTLARMPDGDTLLYCDAGVEITSSVRPLVDLAETNGGIVPFALTNLLICEWTKRDCLVILGCDSPEYYHLDQTNAAIIVFRKCPAAVAFVDEWLAACTDARTLTDDPNVMGKDNLPEFITHRWDQSVLSLLARKKGITHYRDPSQFGTANLKPPAGGDEQSWPWRNSNYPTIFNHHRARSRVLSKLPGLFMQRVGERIGSRYRVTRMFPSRAIKPIIQNNRKTLTLVPRWIEDAVYANSVFQYGLPEHHRPFIDNPIPPDVTYSDAMMYLATFLAKPVNYLELGVSVGKNFAQSLYALKNASLTALDIEDINPALEKLLTRQTVTEIPDPTSSMRKNPIRISDYTFPANGNTVRYVAGDGMHELSWQPLAGRKYNLIFSDMLHAPQGLLFEHEMSRKLDLIDGDEFVMAWDDLGGLMETVFHRIVADLRRQHGELLVTILRVRGWIGRNEGYHRVGFVLKLPAYAKTLSPSLLAALRK
jgi:hypothetical protein